MTRTDLNIIEKALQRLKETELKASVLPRTWGGKLEALYEHYVSLLNKVIDEAWDCDDEEKKKELLEKERRYTGLRDALIAAHPHLLVWAKANGLNN